MATTRPFAYNTGSTIDGTTQIGNIAIGVSEQDYSLNPGGVKWWMGPDEDLGYVIANVVQTGDHPTPVDDDSYINFWRSTDLTDQSLLDLLNVLPITDGVPPFGSANDAKTWLNDNGYFTSYGEGAPPSTPTPTPTVTITSTPTSTVTSTPTNTVTPSTTPTNTPTPTPTAGATGLLTISEVGSDVVMSVSGTIDLTGLTLVASNVGPSGGGGLGTNNASFLSGPTGLFYDQYSGFTITPSNFGTGGGLSRDLSSGDMFGVIGDNSTPPPYFLVVPTGYTSGTQITSTQTFTGQTFTTLGLTVGTYTYTWSGGSFDVVIGNGGGGTTATPTPTSTVTPTNTSTTTPTPSVTTTNTPTTTSTPTPTSAGAGGTGEGSWFFYSDEGSMNAGPPLGNGNALFWNQNAGNFETYNPNYTGSTFQIYLALNDSTGTSYTTQFSGLTTGGTITLSQNGDTATYALGNGQAVIDGPPGSLFFYMNITSGTQTKTSNAAFVSGSTISVIFGNAPSVTPTTTPTPSVTSVTPTPTPTNTVTPTNTQTNTPTPTSTSVTPTPTPTITPTNTVTPTITPSATSMPTNVIVAAGGVNVLGYSYDGGDNWTNSSNGATFISQPAFAVATDGNMFVAGGTASGGNSNYLLWSNDGNTWSGSTNGNTVFNSQVRGIAYGGDKWVAVGISSGAAKIAYSYDGLTWSGATNSNVFGSTPLGVAYNGSRWVATAQKGGGNTNTIAYSDDGITWSAATNSWTIFSGTCWNVAWGGDKWVAVGTGANRMAYSYDGVTWTGSTSGNSRITGTGYGIAHNGSQWVAAGQGTNALAYSSDGITWSGSTNGNTIFSFQSYCVTWVGTKWVAGGIGTNQLATSTDGLTWSATTNGNTVMNNRVQAIAAKY